jgi:hypothetical protein
VFRKLDLIVVDRRRNRFLVRRRDFASFFESHAILQAEEPKSGLRFFLRSVQYLIVRANRFYFCVPLLFPVDSLVFVVNNHRLQVYV